MESIQSIAQELGVDPKLFFDWSITEGPSTESAPQDRTPGDCGHLVPPDTRSETATTPGLAGPIGAFPLAATVRA